MMRKSYSVIVALVCSSLAFAQPNDGLYGLVAPAVGYIRHAVVLDQSYARNQALIRRLETLSKRAILGRELPLASGTAFVITEDGWALTARHVVDQADLRKLRAAVAVEIGNALEKEYAASFSAQELRLIKNDIVSMVNAGELKSLLTLVGKDYAFTVEAAAPASGPDLALLKVAATGLPFLRLAEPAVVGPSLVGKEAYAVGYPLAGVLDMLFQDRVASMTKGSVSAVRKDALSVQHSAPISPGNSGGPLIDGTGRVIGVNSGQIVSGNSLFFAVGADHIATFLEGQAAAIASIKRAAAPAPTQPVKGASDRPMTPEGFSLNALGELELSSDVLVDAEPGAQVYLDGQKLGEAPLFIELKKPVSELAVIGESGEYRAKLRRIGSIQGSTLLSVTLRPVAVELRVETDPAGAEIYLDGVSVGNSPLMLTLKPGSYGVSVKKDGYLFKDETLNLEKARVESTISGRALRVLSVRGLEERSGYSLRFSSSAEIYAFPEGSAIAIPDGTYVLSVTGLEDFKGQSLSIAVDADRREFDVSSLRLIPALSFYGLGPRSVVYINGKRADVPQSGRLELPLGFYDIAIEDPSLRPVVTGVTLRAGQDAWVRLPPQESFERLVVKSRNGILIGSLAAVVGMAVFNHFDGLRSDAPYGSSEERRLQTTADLFGYTFLAGLGIAIFNIPRTLYYISRRETDRKALSAGLEGAVR